MAEEGGGMIMTCKVALVVDVFLVDSIPNPAWGAPPIRLGSTSFALPDAPVRFCSCIQSYLLFFSESQCFQPGISVES